MESSPLEFARPFWLYAGPVVCVLLAWLMLVFGRKREAALAKLVHPRFRHRLMPGRSPRLVMAKRSLWLLAVLLLFVAVAGPRKGYEWREVKRRGIDILFAVDTSRSMLAEDLAPNRLERAKMGIHDFIGRLKGDRVGLIPFAGSSYALCPLTLDYDAFRESLDALDTDLIPRQGTDVASAIREAGRLFTEQGNHHRILVLITDGEDLQGDALDAAEEAKKNGMTIYPVGVGSAEGATIPVRLANGQKDLVRDDAGNPVTTKLDEGMLQKIAETTGGIYAALGRGAEGLDTIYREKLRLLPQNEMDSRMEKIPLERFEWPLAAALVLLLVEFLLPDRRRAAKVRALPSAARRHAPPATTTAMLAATLLSSVSENARAAEDSRAIYNEGTAAYGAGEYTKAAEKLRASLNTPDLDLQNKSYYNLGNALYKMSQEESAEEPLKLMEDAVKAYQDALSLNPGDEDALYNKKVVERKIEELKKKQGGEGGGKGDQNKDQKDEKKDQDKKDGGDQKQDGKSGEDSKDQQSKEGEKSEGKQNSEQHGGDQKQDAPNAERKEEGQQSGEKKDEAATGKPKPEGGGAEKKDGQEQQPAGKDGEKKDEAGAGAEKKDQSKTGAGDEKQAETNPGEEKNDGEKKQAAEAGEAGKEAKDQQGDPAGISEERRTPGEMTKTEARQLLQALRGDQRTVIPLERPDPRRRLRDPANTTKGKTW